MTQTGVCSARRNSQRSLFGFAGNPLAHPGATRFLCRVCNPWLTRSSHHRPSLCTHGFDKFPRTIPTNLSIVELLRRKTLDHSNAQMMGIRGASSASGTIATILQGEFNETNDIPKGILSHVFDRWPGGNPRTHLSTYALRPASQGTPVYL